MKKKICIVALIALGIGCYAHYAQANVSVQEPETENYTVSNLIQQFEETAQKDGVAPSAEMVDQYFSVLDDNDCIFSNGEGVWSSVDSSGELLSTGMLDVPGVDESLDGEDSTTVREAKAAIKQHFGL
ncbi:hypothetical protein AB1I63_07935 [Streptococcus pneumoniae]